MDELGRVEKSSDPFLMQYQESELKIASEFLTTWLPFLSRDLCGDCAQKLSERIGSLESNLIDNADLSNSNPDSNSSVPSNNLESKEVDNNLDDEVESDGSFKDGAEADIHSLGSWRDESDGACETPKASQSAVAPETAAAETTAPRMSWADMARVDELEEEEYEGQTNRRLVDVSPLTGDLRITKPAEEPKLSREQKEHIRFMNVKRKSDFICLERVKGKILNIVEGLELHCGVFSAVEQKRIVNIVYELLENGRKGELKERTYSAPRKRMRGKGRVTLQFGCCCIYATDKDGNPPGILKHEVVDPIPHLFKLIIRRLVRWHVIPPTCVPNSCVVNICEEGDCIPPHIDHHDFVRPFCTVSFLSQCDMVFGTNLEAAGAGEFTGPYAVSLPVGSVLVFKGNSADVAKHCVPSVPYKRISITFRKMDASKEPNGFSPEADLQGIQPLVCERQSKKWAGRRESKWKRGSGQSHAGSGQLRRGSSSSYWMKNKSSIVEQQ